MQGVGCVKRGPNLPSQERKKEGEGTATGGKKGQLLIREISS